jgi:hypothetical protein
MAGTIANLPTPSSVPPRTAIGRWLFSGGPLDQVKFHEEKAYPWFLVVWLTGVDYFSTLAYQPGIALIAAGALSPPATLVLVVVTLLGALPVYAQVASRSYAGLGSIAMLENMLSGWSAKIVVLGLLGFAATDFVITMTLSAADAARHAIANPFLHSYLGDAHEALTIGLLTLLTLVFLMGFQEAINVAALAAIPYLFINLIVLLYGLFRIFQDPDLITHWRLSLVAHGDWTGLFVASAIIFPKLALGLSGFETGVAVMPLVSNATKNHDQAAPEASAPVGRIRATQKLLGTASVIMAVMLLLSSFVTTLLIPEAAYKVGGVAAGRASAYLAHQMLGNAFGTVYDISTIAILWFAGGSAMAGLINLIPRYLPRFGMAPRWVSYRRPMVLVLFAIDLIVTLVFHASVEAQGGAYATGVLVLILSAAVAVAITLWREFRAEPRHKMSSLPLSVYFWGVSALFMYTLIDNIIERPDGVIISTVFVFAIVIVSAISRYQRARELRVSDLTFADELSAQLWPLLVDKKINLVPHASSSMAARKNKSSEIRKHYQLSGPLAFLHVNLLDNRSEFIAPLRVQIRREDGNFVVEVFGAIAIANTIAYVSELIDPIRIFLELTRQPLMLQSLRYLLWGEGEIGLMVYTILLRYWEWTPKGDVRPLILLISE